MKLKKIIILFFILFFSFSTIILAADTAFYEQKVDLDLRGVELEEAFRTLAEIADLNMVVGESIRGRARVSLKDMDFLQAIEMLTKPRELDYRLVDNTIVIDETENLRGFDEKITEVFEIENKNIDEIGSNLENTLRDNTRRNDDFNIDINEDNRYIIMTAYEEQVEKARKILKSLDRKKEQVMLQVIVQDVSRSDIKNLGLNWSFGDLIIENSESDMFDIGLSELDFSDILRFMEEESEAKVLANPQIATLDGQEAEIMVGDRVPIRRDGSGDEQEVEFEEIGVMLNITPEVLRDGTIRISAQPEVSSTTGYEGNMPIISTREVNTNIKVEDGKTIAIGGLIQNETIINRSGIPVLKDIPYLGRIFSTEVKDYEERELMIFITPKIIDDSGSQIEFLNEDDMLKDTNEMLQRIEVGEEELYNAEKDLQRKEKEILEKEENISQREEELLSQEEQIKKISEELDTEKENIKEIIEKFQDEGINIETTSTSMLKEMVEGEKFAEEKEKEEESEELDEKRKNGVITRVISIFKF